MMVKYGVGPEEVEGPEEDEVEEGQSEKFPKSVKKEIKTDVSGKHN